MADTTREAKIVFTADDQTAAVFKQLIGNLGQVGSAIARAKSLMGPGIVAAIVTEVAVAVEETSRAIANYERLGDIAGTTAENISALELPARQAGVSLDSIAVSVAKLGKSIGEARLGAKGGAGKSALLEALGVDVNAGQDAAEIFVQVSKAIASMQDQTVGAYAASQLLEKSFAETRAFAKQLADQTELHPLITNEEAAAAKQFQDTLTQIGLEGHKVWLEFTNFLMPALNGIASTMLQIQKGGATMSGLDMMGGPMFTSAGGAADALGNEARRAGAGGGSSSGAEAAVRRRMAFEENYKAMIADAQGFAATYAEQTKIGNALAQEAYKQGLMSQVEYMNRVAANDDAALGEKIKAYKITAELEAKKGDPAALEVAARAREIVIKTQAEREGAAAIAQAKLTSLGVGLVQRDAEQRSYALRLTDLAQFEADGILTADQANTAREALAAEHQAKMVAIAQAEWQNRVLFAQFTNKDLIASNQYLFGTLQELMQSHSRSVFELGKAAAIAHTVISTYEAAQTAFAWGMKTGGPFLAAAFAAAAVAAGLVRVQAIQATAFGGAGASPTYAAVPGTTVPSAPIGGAAIAPPPTVQAQAQAAPAPRVVNVTFEGEGIVTQQWVRETLIPELNDALGDGAIINVT
jgi:hypothetical protein